MANLAVLPAAVLIFAIVVGGRMTAAAHKTIVTTVISDDEGYLNGDIDCQKEIRRHDLSSCEHYMRHGNDVLRAVVPNQHALDQCCRQMDEVDRRCRCDAVREIVQKEQRQTERGGEEAETLQRRAHEIASRCGLESECRRDHQEAKEKEREECRREIERQDLRACTEHLMKGRRERDDDSLNECCRRLQGLDERCQCEGISHVVRRRMEEGEVQEEERREMLRRARELPQQCHLSAPCDIRAAV